ncbi:MAG: hypothetical protein ACI4YB_10375 [Oscillospiraceae bacterium]
MASNQTNRNRTSGSKMINGSFVGAVFLGICVLISGLSIGGGIRKLNKTLADKSFSNISNVTQPDAMKVSEKKYLTEDEAATYLNLTSQEIVTLITTGEITEYVKTGTGYSISVKVLDDWFDNESYQNKLAGNSSDSGESSDTQ